ncbi:MAG: ATP-dependent zinc protease [FCB group bacterium]|nr:ATP-dependent zinc protease [FCB group bacterium]MBL7029447.1 ATP-dependent zinc protease [Candidatus Neomarinimicrobiota bacterium]
MKTSKSQKMPVVGWREWVELPDLGVKSIKAKVDTGARSSSLHAFGMETFKKDDRDWVRFNLHPIQRRSKPTILAEAEVLEYRSVRSSSGKASLRPVIITTLNILGQSYKVELTLASRDKMGFRMLLGREAIRSKFLVDSGRSFFGGKPPRRKKLKSK